MSLQLVTPHDGIRLLQTLGASPWLVRHHELVVEAATLVCDGIARDVKLAFDRDAVLVGASLHDAGKIVHPGEMSAPGSQHEQAGQTLLLEHGAPTSIARFCVTHAAWDVPGATIEDLLVALADKLWKGKRDEALEQVVVERLAAATSQESWAVFEHVDALCETIAADGPDRLSRSVV